ncbi:MAG: hypothetical protein HY703_02670 [Gemmatimonadetes bacterium]|nr:hypothetical protein [Gemmatimonadota bacterium]
MIELLLVLMIGAVLTSMASPRVGHLQAVRALVNAQNSAIFLAARARAVAVERGKTARLEVDPLGDRAWIVVLPSDTVSLVDYRDEFAADVFTTTGTTLTVCYTPRGFALPSCTSPNLPAFVGFSRGRDTLRVRVRPLGQVEKYE